MVNAGGGGSPPIEGAQASTRLSDVSKVAQIALKVGAVQTGLPGASLGVEAMSSVTTLLGKPATPELQSFVNGSTVAEHRENFVSSLINAAMNHLSPKGRGGR